MPIGKTQYGVHADTLVLQFGLGDIRFTKGCEDGSKFQSVLMFTRDSPHEIGAETSDYLDQSSDALPNVPLVMRFTKPESITALIHSLVEIQKDLFRAQTQQP